ncbi:MULTISPECIES: helix-turn-helix transcriptional regulator [unclassified Streptomyces]|uniref:helix-turn-helix transcriptional regulator n=1 Tax=unclassified Streptomyces TaxID=2593676 RepID=UPI0003687386|nr:MULTISPECIES: helix-turn-helix transcriptional regulator [unclassified Streptomyces]MYT28596.1 LuxR family transcriptional regulator [Streptomyces sp. SID8354]
MSQRALEVFEFAADRTAFDIEDLAALGLDADEAERAVKELAGLRLLSHAEGAPGRLAIVPPRIAANRLLRPMEREVRSQQDEIERFRWMFETLVPAYESGQARNTDVAHVEMIDDLRLVQELIEELSLNCRAEVLTAQPGGARSPEALRTAWERDRGMLARGVAMRTLYQHPARYHQPTIDHVQRMTSLGAEVRTQSESLCRMLVFDRHAALLGVPDGPQAALLIREPRLIHSMRVFFDWAWRGASPFPLSFDAMSAVRISGEIQETIVAMLAEGLEDKSIARRLGMSVRSCQRHVAEVMKALGAKSRFQAGFLIGQSRGRPGEELPAGAEPLALGAPLPSGAE